MAAIAAAVVGTITAHMLGKMFPPSGQVSVTVTLDQARFERVIIQLGADFAATVDASIRGAFFQHTFSQIKVKTQVAAIFFSDHLASITPQQPLGDTTDLSNAYFKITEAFEDLCDQIDTDLIPALPLSCWSKVCIEHAETDIDAIRDSVRNWVLLDKQHEQFHEKLGKCKAYLLTAHTIISLSLLILARRCDTCPSLINVIPRALRKFQERISLLQDRFKQLQTLRIRMPVEWLQDGDVPMRKGVSDHPPITGTSIIRFSTLTDSRGVYKQDDFSLMHSFHNGNRCTLTVSPDSGQFTQTFDFAPPLEHLPNGVPVYLTINNWKPTIRVLNKIGKFLEANTHRFATEHPQYLAATQLHQDIDDFQAQITPVAAPAAISSAAAAGGGASQPASGTTAAASSVTATPSGAIAEG